ncbi:MAG TPA: thioredoxin domain-containing protein [Dermatophilaceae bacterium]|nr:thioredoxin domain-containing protein [Dermatophilaceae bacterium]
MASGKQSRAERQRKIAAAAPKQSNTRLIIGVVIAVLAILAASGVIWVGARESGGAPTAGKDFPAGATGPDGGIVVSGGGVLKPGIPTLDVYADFQCPFCKVYDGLLGTTVENLATSGKANVVHHLKTFLDANLRNDASKRASNAAACAADAGKFLAYRGIVFANQPANEGDGWSDEQLRIFADQVGVSGPAREAWDTCVKDGSYRGYLQRVEDASSRAGVLGTPTYRVNGQSMDFKQVKGEPDVLPTFNAEYARLTGLKGGSNT